MGRFLGIAANRGAGGGGGSTLVQEFDRATGITTDASNNVTSVTLGDMQYTNVLYHGTQAGVVTSFTESSGGASKDYVISYDGDFHVTSITEVV